MPHSFVRIPVVAGLIAVMLSAVLHCGVVAAADPAARYQRGFLVDLSASWCKPCQSMMPAIERLQREGLPIRQFDIDRRPDLKAKYQVTSLPTLLLVVDNKIVRRVEGAVGEAELRNLIGEIPTSIDDPDASRFVRKAPKRRRSPLQLASNATPKRTRPVVRANAADPTELLDATGLGTGPMPSSVRIRVLDGGVVNYGSGTIVDSRVGQSLIVTCGHLFRDVNEDAQVEVDFYRGDTPETIVGRCVDFDLKSDVGLISVPTTTVWPCSEIASSAEAPREGAAVLTIGCSGGEDPTPERTTITKLNRYLGPDNIEVDRRPVRGRSGGGLFDRDGRLVGVCNAEVPESNKGLYAGLAAIHDLLDESNLATLYRDPVDESSQRSGVQVAMADGQPRRLLDSPPDSRPADDYSQLLGELEASWPDATAPGRGRDSELAQTSQQTAASDETEIVCIIRSKRDPKGTSRVVIIDAADTELLERIEGPRR